MNAPEKKRSLAWRIAIISPIAPGIEIRSVTFTSQRHSVRGRLFIPAGDAPTDVVLLLPGFPGNEKDVLGVGERLVRAGASNVRIETFATDHSFSNVQDELAADIVDWIGGTSPGSGS